MNTSHYLISSWNWNPAVIGAGAVATLVYVRVVKNRASGRARYLVAALVTVAVALLSPLNALAAGYLFSAHMVQHMLLLLVAPMFVLLSLPVARTSELAKPPRVHPLMCWIAGVGAMWVWHERTLCELATETEVVRSVQVVSLLALGTLFWWPIVGRRAHERLPPLTGVAYLFAACVACSALGIYLAFAPLGVCPAYLHPPNQPSVLHLIRNEWGVTPARDQQIGGLLMWLPGCGIYLASAMALLARWYGAEPDELAIPNRVEGP